MKENNFVIIAKSFLDYYSSMYIMKYSNQQKSKSIVDFLKEELDDAYKAESAIVDGIAISDFLNEKEKEKLDRLLLEAKDIFKKIPGTNYSHRIDNSRGEPGKGNQRHIHIYQKGKHLFAMNQDGTAHDGCHHVKIDSRLHDFLIKKGFIIPPNGLIEVLLPRDCELLLG